MNTPIVLDWLLEEQNPGVRYLTLRDLCDFPENDPELVLARKIAHRQGPIATVLDAMQPEGYWEKKRAGYNPKYTGTVWSVILLAQLGARVEMDERVALACDYLLSNARTKNGQFGTQGTPSTTIDCLQGNICAAMLDLGIDDDRLNAAFDWLARSNTGEGIAPMGSKDTDLRYYSGKIGPAFLCGANDKKACAWGAVKVMLALAKLPEFQHTPIVKEAIQIGTDFLLGIDPVTAEYPTRLDIKPSRNWWKFGFPVFYISDVLQILEAFSELNMLDDPRLKNALNLVRSKQDDQGRWPLEYSYKGKTWIDVGETKQPNKWVTLRALRVLKKVT